MEVAIISLLSIVIVIMVFLFWRLSKKQGDDLKEKQLLNEEVEKIRHSLLEQEKFLAYTSHELRDHFYCQRKIHCIKHNERS
jgi:nitrogen fixation-related uncharacterized protein